MVLYDTQCIMKEAWWDVESPWKHSPGYIYEGTFRIVSKERRPSLIGGSSSAITWTRILNWLRNEKKNGVPEFTSLCFLMAGAMWLAAWHVCHHAFFIMMVTIQGRPSLKLHFVTATRKKELILIIFLSKFNF